MAKVEVLGRHCIVCNKFWVARHPHDLNPFCPDCHEALCKVIKSQKDGAGETKRIKYFDEDEKVWKIGEVIVEESE